MDSNREHDTISQRQWDEFTAQFQRIVNTLQQVASVWNLEDPVVISGFDMDRAGTISALANEPAGTFICRFSMSQPGCLVLTCKSPAHPKADGMGLIHAIIKVRPCCRSPARASRAAASLSCNVLPSPDSPRRTRLGFTLPFTIGTL